MTKVVQTFKRTEEKKHSAIFKPEEPDEKKQLATGIYMMRNVMPPTAQRAIITVEFLDAGESPAVPTTLNQ